MSQSDWSPDDPFNNRLTPPRDEGEEMVVIGAQEDVTLGTLAIQQAGDQQTDKDASPPSLMPQLDEDVVENDDPEPADLDEYTGANPPEKYDAATMEWSVLKANLQQSSIFLRQHYSDWAPRMQGGREEILSLVLVISFIPYLFNFHLLL